MSKFFVSIPPRGGGVSIGGGWWKILEALDICCFNGGCGSWAEKIHFPYVFNPRNITREKDPETHFKYAFRAFSKDEQGDTLENKIELV